MTFQSDAHYKEWRKTNDRDIQSGITLIEEQAIFVDTRAGVLRFHNRLSEAVTMYSEAY